VTDVALHASPRLRSDLLWWTVALTSVALVVVMMDDIVVTTAVPTIQRDIDASIESLEWSVNAYGLALAVFLLVGARLGDRFGRRRVFSAGLAMFGAASAGCALAPNVELFDGARAFQGLAAAIVAASSLTILRDAFPGERRRLAVGLWWGIGALGVLLGPLVGGIIVYRTNWQWIFWLNVPIAIGAIALALVGIRETHGPRLRVDLPGLVLAGAALVGIVLGVTRGHLDGWTSQQVLPALGAGAILLGAFVVWELGAAAPILPVWAFGNRRLAAVNFVSLLASFAVFGSLFLLIQFLLLVRNDSSLRAGLATLALIAAMLVVVPLAGALAVRLGAGARWFVGIGLAVQTVALAWFAHVSAVDLSYPKILAGFAVFGAGVGLLLPPMSSLVIAPVPPVDAAQASLATNAAGAAGGALGIAALTAVLLESGSYASADAFTDGFTVALWVGAAVTATAALLSMLMPGRKPSVPEVAATVVGPPGGSSVPESEEEVSSDAPVSVPIPAIVEERRPLPTIVRERPVLPAETEPAPDSEPDTFPCPVCHGEGRFTFVPPQDPHTKTCPRCYGHGSVLTGSHVPDHMVRECPDCYGWGYVAIEALPEPTYGRTAVLPVEPAELGESLPRANVAFGDLRQS